MVLLGIDYLVWVILTFQISAGLGVLVLILIGPITTLVLLAFARMGLELMIAMVRTAENTAGLAHLNGGGRPLTPGPAYSTGPQTPPAPSGIPTTGTPA